MLRLVFKAVEAVGGEEFDVVVHYKLARRMVVDEWLCSRTTGFPLVTRGNRQKLVAIGAGIGYCWRLRDGVVASATFLVTDGQHPRQGAAIR
jgi:hypothetical protein